LKEQKDIRPLIDQIILEEETSEAINRLNGFLKQYFWNQYLRTKLGRLYLEDGKPVMAGKLLYLVDNLNEEEIACVNKFGDKCGNRKLEILRKILGNNKSKPARGISVETNYNLFRLFTQIAEQEGSLPRDIVLWIYSYERIRNIELKNGWLEF